MRKSANGYPPSLSEKHLSFDCIEERTVNLANYIIENRCTVREAAKYFGISKSTVHKDITQRLRKINLSLANATQEILQENKQERHIRGGYATREKYRKIRSSS